MNNTNHFYDNLWNSRTKKDTDNLLLTFRKEAIDYSYSIIGNLKGKKILEIGCGSGAQTLDFCKKGANVFAIDFSSKSVEMVKKRCKEYKIDTSLMKTEKLDFDSEQFDSVYLNSVLMYVNKEEVLKEIKRILKPGGKYVIVEPLKFWLFSFPYRFVSPYRKTNPKYISLRDVESSNMSHEEFYLFSTLFLGLFYMFRKKKWVYRLFRFMVRLDSVFIKLPLIRNFAWITVASYTK